MIQDKTKTVWKIWIHDVLAHFIICTFLTQKKFFSEWKTVEHSQKVVQLFFEQLREEGKRQPSLFLSLDARDTDEERDRSLISFYKQREKNQWAAPFRCHIQGIN